MRFPGICVDHIVLVSILCSSLLEKKIGVSVAKILTISVFSMIP